MTIDQLKESHLVTGEHADSDEWDAPWRLMLVENLSTLASELWQVGIKKVFIDGSFVEKKNHPNDIDGYFECEMQFAVSGDLQSALNAIAKQKIWTWNPKSRRYDSDTKKKQLPMWHEYLVELYPHIPGMPCGIKDENGHEQEFPSAFRKTRDREVDGKVTKFPKGIIELLSS